jgi:F0F1-type ATP synthase assembly protein I
MNNESKDPQKKTSPDQIGVWLVIGAGIGVTFGIIFDNLAMASPWGLPSAWFSVPRFR